MAQTANNASAPATPPASPPIPASTSHVDTKAMKGAAAVDMPLAKVWADTARNPRQDVDSAADKDLLESIVSRKRVIEPICVTAQKNPKSGAGEYRVTKGYRRYKCAVIAKLETIPVVIEMGVSAEQEFQEAIEENEKRSDFTAWDRVHAVGMLVRDDKEVKDVVRVMRGGTNPAAESTIYRYAQMAKGLDRGVMREMAMLPYGKALWDFALSLCKKGSETVTKEGYPVTAEQVKAWKAWRADWDEKNREKTEEEKKTEKTEREKRIRWTIKAEDIVPQILKRARKYAKDDAEGAALIVETIEWLTGKRKTPPEWYEPSTEDLEG